MIPYKEVTLPINHILIYHQKLYKIWAAQKLLTTNIKLNVNIYKLKQKAKKYIGHIMFEKEIRSNEKPIL